MDSLGPSGRMITRQCSQTCELPIRCISTVRIFDVYDVKCDKWRPEVSAEVTVLHGGRGNVYSENLEIMGCKQV